MSATHPLLFCRREVTVYGGHSVNRSHGRHSSVIGRGDKLSGPAGEMGREETYDWDSRALQGKEGT